MRAEHRAADGNAAEQRPVGAVDGIAARGDGAAASGAAARRRRRAARSRRGAPVRAVRSITGGLTGPVDAVSHCATSFMARSCRVLVAGKREGEAHHRLLAGVVGEAHPHEMGSRAAARQRPRDRHSMPSAGAVARGLR